MNNSLLANKYLLILIVFILLFCTYFLLNTGSQKITPFIVTRAALASGVDFNTKKLVVVNTDNSQLVAPCNPIVASDMYPTNGGKHMTKATDSYKGIPDCTVQILTDSNQELSNALEISKKTLEGRIKINGESKPATFVIAVIGVYSGSNCNTTSSGGNQYQHCSNHGGF